MKYFNSGVSCTNAFLPGGIKSIDFHPSHAPRCQDSAPAGDSDRAYADADVADPSPEQLATPMAPTRSEPPRLCDGDDAEGFQGEMDVDPSGGAVGIGVPSFQGVEWLMNVTMILMVS